MTLDTIKRGSNLAIEEQVANIFDRAKSGEPFGTKQDVNILIDKICDHIYRKLIEENWCPCDRHSNTALNNADNLHRDVSENVTEGYMQRIRRKVLEILSEYLATFKNQLFAKYGVKPTDPLALNGEETVPVSEPVTGDPSLHTMAKTDSSLSQVDKSQPSGLKSVTNTNVCDNSLSDVSIDDWVRVGRCLSRENYFDQSPRASVSASPATSRWSSGPEAEGGSRFDTHRKLDRKTQSCTVTPREVRSDRDTTGTRLPDDESVTPGDELATKETFKKTLDPKLIKKSPASMEKPQEPLLTETLDYHPDHFRHDTELAAISKDIDRAEVRAAIGDSRNGTSSQTESEVPTTDIEGDSNHLHAESPTVYRRRSLRSGKRPTSAVRMRRRARNVVQFLMQLRKPVRV